MSVKPILMNTEMVRALSANRKTATRRVVKGYALEHLELDTDGSIIGVYDQFEGHVRPVMDYSPYRPGDILYVRETWTTLLGSYLYKANQKPCMKNPGKWRPSIHMPREAARIFLLVTDVRAERLQDITEDGAKAEGAIDNRGFIHSPGDEYDVIHSAREHFAGIWNACYAKPRPVKGEGGTIGHYEGYPWDDIQETRTYRGKPWYVIGNPWVWVIEFERISREEA